jgi:superfamily II RNA helicase
VFQKNAINSIEEGNHVLVTAHTSAGKTTVAEYAIAKAKELGKKIIYTSPIKTLSNQKYYDFAQQYDSVGILTGDIKQNPDADIIIMTTEILRNMLFRSNEMIKDVQFIIFDEVHYINDQDRGHVWEETLIMIPNYIQIVMLSATINNPEKLGNWVALKGKQVDMVGTKFRPVPLVHNIFYKDELVPIMNNSYKLDLEKYSEIESYYNKEFKKYFKPNGRINDLVNILNERELFPCIFFSYSRKKCEDYAKMISTSLVDHDEIHHIEFILNKYLKGMFKNYEKLEQTQTLRKLLMKGIGFHHSGLVHPLKEIQEILFSKGLIKILFATETFAVGVNMPTRTVIFTELSKFDGNMNGFRNLNTAEYLQMAGRAGRRGKDKEGIVIYLPLKSPPSCPELKKIFTGNAVSISSKLKLNTKFLMKVIQTDDLAINNFLKLSLLGEENKVIEDSKKEQYNSLKEQVERLKINMIDMLKHTEVINDILRLEKELLSAKGNKHKKLTHKIESLKFDKQVLREYNTKKSYMEQLEKLNILEKEISQNSLLLELSVARNFLQDLNFISETNKSIEELSRDNLTKKGLMASEINECNEVLLTELIDRNLLDDLTLPEIFGVLAIFIEDRSDDEIFISSLEITDNMKEVLYEIGDLNIELDNVAINYNIGYNPYLSLSFVLPAYMWANGEEVYEIYKKNSIEMYEGNFVKNIFKILNICNEITYVCELIGKPNLIRKLENIESIILRDIVSFDSIYLLNN